MSNKLFKDCKVLAMSLLKSSSIKPTQDFIRGPQLVYWKCNKNSLWKKIQIQNCEGQRPVVEKTIKS